MPDAPEDTPRPRLRPYRFAPGAPARPIPGLHGDYDPGLLAGIPDRIVDGARGFGAAPDALAVGEGMRVADLGCGAGLDLVIAGRATGEGGAVAGIDPDAGIVAEARAAVPPLVDAPVDLCRGRAEALPWPDREFDRVLMNCSLSLVGDPAAALAEAARIARPGATLAVLDLAVDPGLDPGLRRALSGGGSGVEGALDPGDLRRLAGRAGWGVERCDERRWNVEDLWAAARRAGARPEHRRRLQPLLSALADRTGRITLVARRS